jgi:hypothetical protein
MAIVVENPYKSPATQLCRQADPENAKPPIRRYTRQQRVMQYLLVIVAAVVLAMLLLPALAGVADAPAVHSTSTALTCV